MKKTLKKVLTAGGTLATTFLAGATKVAAQYSSNYSTTSEMSEEGVMAMVFGNLLCTVCFCIFYLVILTFTVWMLIDALKRDESVLPGKIKWALLIFFTAPIGGLVYFFTRKKKMD